MNTQGYVSTTVAPPGPSGPDQAALLQHFDCDMDILTAISEVFLAECPSQLAAVQSAVASSDASALPRSAHKLKGAVGIFGDTDAFGAVERLEVLGKSKALAGAAETCAHVEDAVSRLTVALSCLPLASAA